MRFFSFLYNFIKIDIPSDLKKEFGEELLKKNYNKLTVTSVVFFLIELIIYILPQRLFEYKNILIHVLAINLLLIPLFFIISRNFNKFSKVFKFLIQDIYIFTMLFFAMLTALKSQGSGDFVHLYLMAAMSFATFFYIKYLNGLFLFGTIFILFTVMLPYYQFNPSIAFVIRANAVLFNILSFIMIHIRLRSKTASFKDKKLLEKIAQSDSMTEFYNHKTSILSLEKEITKSKEHGFNLSLIMIDIDNFKEINDKLGHIQGDEIIKSVAKIIRLHTREGDIIGRYGGDEFIIILPKTDITEANNITKKIFRTLSSKKIPVTLSAGISQHQGENVNDFIRNTDVKLYKAKQMGKNRYESN